jgi:hypothetical protein
MPDGAGHRERKLVVTGQKPITNMKLHNGGTATIFEVFAKTEGGEYVEEPLRSFTELDIGQVIQYRIEPYNHAVHGISYTLYPPKKEFPRRMREAEEKLGALLTWAERQGFNLQRELRPEPVPPRPEEIAAAEDTKRKLDRETVEKFGDNVPWEDPARDLEAELEASLNPEENDETAGSDSDVPEQGGGHPDADGSAPLDQGDDGPG